MHHVRERQSLAIHRRIAGLIAENPDAVIAKAKENLDRWSRKSESGLSPAHAEWLAILNQFAPSEIASLIVSTDEKATRLRQSSPFAGVLPPREVWAIKRNHEAA